MSGSVKLEKFIDELISRSIEEGYTPQTFIDMRYRHGTVEAIKRLVTSRNIQQGLKRLGELNLLDLSVEAAVLKFPEEFTHEEQETSRWRLEQVKKSFGLQKEEPSQTAENYFNRAFKSYTEGNYDGAIEDYTEGLRLEPNDVYAWLNRGNAWLRKSEHDKAINDYNDAIQLNPNFAAAWSGRGEAWYRKGEYDKAIGDFNETLRLSPSSSNAWRVRGNAWRKKGEYDKAVADYKKALTFFPQDEEIKQNLNVTLALQASGAEREEVVENLKLEYDKKLTERVDIAVGRILKDRTGFRFSYIMNMVMSILLRITAVGILLTIAFVWIEQFVKIYNYEMQGASQAFKPDIFLSWAPIFTTLTAPVLLVVWLLLRWGYEAKTISYAFQRKAILEERILLYFNNDVEKLKDMQEFFINHWMEKSPLEVMLAIAGKRKHGGEVPMDAVLGKLEELINISKAGAGKGGD